MNKRQELIIEYLENAERNNINLQDIYIYINALARNGWCKAYQTWNGGCDFSNSSARRQITHDLELIELNPEFKKIIVRKPSGIHIVNDVEEANAYIDYLFRKAKLEMKRYALALYRKTNNNQLKYDSKFEETSVNDCLKKIDF